MKHRILNLTLFFAILLTSQLFSKEAPKRIISLAPNITEIIYKIDAGDLLIGRTDYCLFPKAVESVKTVGGYLNPDFEKMVALKPDIVFLLPNGDLERKLNRLGLKTFTLPDETIEEILMSTEALGRVLGRPGKAGVLVQGIQDTLDWVKNNSTGRYPMSALLVVGREAGSLKSIYAAGQETYLSELLELAGGQNVYDDVTPRYFDVSKEDLIRRNPDTILEFRIIDPKKAHAEVPQLIEDWQTLSTLKAVRYENIHIFTERYFIIPGPRIAQIAMVLFDVFQQAAE